MYGLRFGRRRDSYGPVGTCCLLIKCKRAASLSLDSPPRALLARVVSLLSPFSPTYFRLPLFPLLSIQKPEAALVSRRNQPRADNNEIHKSVREHAEHTPRPGTPLAPFFLYFSLFLFLSFPPATLSGPSVFTRVATFPCSASLRLRRVTLDRVLSRVETSLRFFTSAARPGYIVYASQVRSDALRITSLELVCNRERLSERNYLVSFQINQRENGRNFSCKYQNLKLINYFRGY